MPRSRPRPQGPSPRPRHPCLAAIPLVSLPRFRPPPGGALTPPPLLRPQPLDLRLLRAEAAPRLRSPSARPGSALLPRPLDWQLLRAATAPRLRPPSTPPGPALLPPSLVTLSKPPSPPSTCPWSLPATGFPCPTAAPAQPFPASTRLTCWRSCASAWPCSQSPRLLPVAKSGRRCRSLCRRSSTLPRSRTITSRPRVLGSYGFCFHACSSTAGLASVSSPSPSGVRGSSRSSVAIGCSCCGTSRSPSLTKRLGRQPTLRHRPPPSPWQPPTLGGPAISSTWASSPPPGAHCVPAPSRQAMRTRLLSCATPRAAPRRRTSPLPLSCLRSSRTNTCSYAQLLCCPTSSGPGRRPRPAPQATPPNSSV